MAMARPARWIAMLILCCSIVASQDTLDRKSTLRHHSLVGPTIKILYCGFAERLLDGFNLGRPSIYLWANENKITACMIIFFLLNSLEQQLLSTGAFEVTLNGINVWSKLNSGRLPSADELQQIIQQQYSFKSI
ncbi:Selenoprotein T [Trichoplax sp. H2]|nr:Selenoprotein T [Trichoplax sp. H2]|eukprot:RDD37840.1 Selenoprotein T [Trichoplax sp. H2]